MKTLARFLTQSLKRWYVPVFAMVATLGLAVSCSSTFAQSGAGSIQGTVTDATGAVIPGATIHVVNQGTNVATDTKSNEVGFYQVPALFTGTYSVAVTAPGMNTFKTSIELLVAQNAVINPVLNPGSVTQQVEVLATTVQLTTTDNGTISSTLENSRINQLPMNGRNILNLAAESTPGLGSCNQDANGQCANGLMGYGMEYVADGVTLQGREFGGGHVGQAQFPDPDSIQEVRVQTVGTSAQYATPATGVITTKSGTNSLHGSLFETARNSYWGVAKQRQNPSDYVAPPYIRNEFGASVGGPIVLPHVYHGKDKSFFFFAYERYSLASIAGETAHVPPAAWRNGDFSGMTNSSNNLQVLYDPNTTQYVGGTWTRQTFTQEYGEGPGNPSMCNGNINCIPANRESPTAQMVNAISPLPSPQYANVNPLVSSNLSADNPTELRAPTYTFRLDHAFNENNRAYLRFTDTPETNRVLRNQPSAQPATIAASVNGVNFPANASGVTYYQYDMINSALGFTHVFSPTFYMETIASQQWFQEQNNAGGSPLTNFETQLGLPNNFGEVGFPYFENIVFPVNGTQFIYGVTQIIDNLDENMVKTIGKHQLQFGGRYRHERFGSRPDEAQDNIQFGTSSAPATGLLNASTIASNGFSTTSNTGQLNADFFIGAPSIYSVNKQASYQHMHDMEFDAYLQDNYHVARNLTLNLGLRYESHPAMWEKYGLMTSFDLKNDAMVLGAPIATLISEGFTTQAAINNDIYDGAKFETAQQAGLPDKLINDDNLVFEPRLGIAWLPFGRSGTVLRGGYGMYAFPVPFRSSVKNVAGNNPFQINYQRQYNSASQAPDGLNGFLLRSKQSTATPLPGVTNGVGFTPVMGVNSSNAVDSSTTTSILPGFGNFSINPDYPVDLATNANFTIEQPLKWNSALRVSYVWSHGDNLDQYFYYNNHPSGFVWEMLNGKATPNGGASVIGTSAANTYSSTATGPYDQTTWGGNSMSQKTGWSNDNQLQVSFQKLYHRGLAWQVMYDWQKNLRVGGNWSRDNQVDPYADYANSGLSTYGPAVCGAVLNPWCPVKGALDTAAGTPITPALPPSPPSGTPAWAYYKALNRFENYGTVDTATPKQQLQYNYIVDLPFGRGKRFLGNVNRLVNELVGGYQIAGTGNLYSTDFTITATNWGPTNPLKTYKHGVPVTDCRSGTCYKNYLWWNGYIAPTAISGNTCSAGLANVVSGLPSNYAPYQTPMGQGCSAPSGGKTVTDANFGNNNVGILFPGSTTPSTIAYAPSPSASSSGSWAGSNPFSKTVLNGPFNIVNDASLFKVFPITERVNMRFNMDVFNVFNNQGSVGPSGSDGVQNLNLSSNNSARQLQFTLRLNF
jgi:Carboxypeptidase regulatory-like domain